jgi:protein-S-isoprenylcysteine O-methyltransferase Ste14
MIISTFILACWIVFMLVGLASAILARRKLAGSWSGQVAIKEGHELITTGLYRSVRTPSYSGVLLMALGSVLFLGTLGAVIGFLTIVPGVILKLRDEEKILAGHCGRDYASYRQHSKALTPFLW